MGYRGVSEDLVKIEACLVVLCRQWCDYSKVPVPAVMGDILNRLSFANAACKTLADKS